MEMVYKQQESSLEATPVLLDGEQLIPELVAEVVYDLVPVALDEQALGRVMVCRKMVEELVATGQVVYGVTTGFGKFSDVTISPQDAVQLFV